MKNDKDLLDRSVNFLWGLVLLCLPVTSFPFFPFLGSGTQVRPLSIYPMALLLPLLLLQIWKKRVKPSHPVFTVLGIFLFIIFATAFTGALLAPVEIRGQDYWGRVIRAVITILIGLGFFLSALWSSRDREQLRNSLKWLYLGLVLTFLWGMVQYATYKGWILDESTLDKLQKLVSVSGISLKNLRIHSFAFEPSWLAGMIAVIYMPWLFGSLLTGFRVSRWRWLELVLIGLALVLLVLTYSRSGLVMVLVTCFLTTLLFGSEKIRQAWIWWKKPFWKTREQPSGSLTSISIRLVILLALFASFGVGIKVLSDNPYFARIWQSRKTNLIDYVIDIYVGPRLAYVWSGLETFNQHPWTGVGLGAGGFYFYDNLPDWSRTFIPEISTHLSPLNTAYPNTKNLFVRILSETGIIGFASFAGFLLYLLAASLAFRKKRGYDNRYYFVTGVFTWIALIIYCFTQDSFAMTTTWINMGILLGLENQDIRSG